MKRREMVKYDYKTADRSDPRWYENQPDQTSKDTATVWALHLNIDDASDLDKVLAVVSQVPEATGEYCWGDSWDVWGEDSSHPDHLVVYFRSVLPAARETGEAITLLVNEQTGVGGVETFDVSTAGDWGEIILGERPR